jgi:hypothetical protein
VRSAVRVQLIERRADASHYLQIRALVAPPQRCKFRLGVLS